jgi:hypothetical protein
MESHAKIVALKIKKDIVKQMHFYKKEACTSITLRSLKLTYSSH